MKTLIIGAGPLGGLYATLLHKAGNDVTLLARNRYYDFLKQHGIVLVNEFTGDQTIEHTKFIRSMEHEDAYDLAMVIMRKNSIKKLLPDLAKMKNIKHFLFMGNNACGFDEYLNYLPEEKILFGFPGGGGSRIDHIIHYIDSEKPRGRRMPVTLGEIDGTIKPRTKEIQNLFKTSGIPVNIVHDIDSWLKYHVAFVLPVGGALLTSGDNYKLAEDEGTIRKYIRAVREGGKVLKSLGWTRSYNIKFRLFNWLPEGMLIRILKKVFNSKFAEVAMMMHVNAAADEMIELGNEFGELTERSKIDTPNMDEMLDTIFKHKVIPKKKSKESMT
ncbi:MAG: 2-dehydropantoate 2-reductase N-terminal domain-containing protein [Cyclobacteriaceae bacterium]|jgi:2-dehydropantoate 2-reductase